MCRELCFASFRGSGLRLIAVSSSGSNSVASNGGRDPMSQAFRRIANNPAWTAGIASHYPFLVVRITCRVCSRRGLSSRSISREIRAGDQPSRPHGPFLLRLPLAGRGTVKEGQVGLWRLSARPRTAAAARRAAGAGQAAAGPESLRLSIWSRVIDCPPSAFRRAGSSFCRPSARRDGRA